MGDQREGEEFFYQYASPAVRNWPRVADPEKKLYEAFGLERGTIGRLMGLRTILIGARAFFAGFRQGKPIGDVAQMPGAFLIRGDEVLKEFIPRINGEQPDFVAMATV